MTPAEIESILQETIKRHVDPDEFYVFLFGSRATEESEPASDFDIGIWGDREVSRRAIAKIEDELEEYPIPVEVDIIDFSNVTDDFKKIALKQVKIWNTPKIALKQKLPF